MNKTHVDEVRVRAFAAHLSTLKEVQPFDFCSISEGVIYPTRALPGVLDTFFFCTSHQFGFWTMKENRYERPMTARLDGVAYKGSDYVWRCATRAWSRREDFFSPAHAATLSDRDWNDVFCDDTGRNPLPMWDEHMRIIHGYLRWMEAAAVTPKFIVARCRESETPLATLVEQSRDIPGYGEDRLQKKLFLLAIILENRPEHFLSISDPQSYKPIIDYHLQRSALRTGLVQITDRDLHAKLVRRERVEAGEEALIRNATYEAIQLLVKQSGLSVAAIDYFFFINRRRCPEMTIPECAACPVNGICAHELSLFQPVYRTTDY